MQQKLNLTKFTSARTRISLKCDSKQLFSFTVDFTCYK